MTTLDKELLWEKEIIDSGVLRYYRNIDRTKKKINSQTGESTEVLNESNTSYGISMLRYFVISVAKQLKADSIRMKGKAGRKPIAWEYLSELQYETTAYITCKCILDSITRTVKLTQLINRIASKVEDNTRFEAFEKDDKKYLKSTLRFIKNEKINNYHRKRRIIVNSAIKKNNGMQWTPWPIQDKIHLGIACIESFIKATSDYNSKGKRIRGSGLIEISTQYINNKTLYTVYGTSKAYDWIKGNTEVCQYLMPDYMPVLYPPKPWSTPTDGGFHLPELRRMKPLVKMQQPKYLKLMHENRANMPEFFRTVNILQAVPWEVNNFVLEQARKEFSSSHGIDMPSIEPMPEPLCPLDPFIQGDMSNREFAEYKRDKKKALTEKQKIEFVNWKAAFKNYKKEETQRVSNALGVSRTLNTAKKLQFEEEIYFVWTADFRGRLYTVGTALSPQGTELSKALLKFKRGCKLGTNGFKHLCLHAAGVFGNDKCSLDDRIKWVQDNKELIIGTGTEPDNYRDFWGSADKPYMFLAVCQELAECIQLSTKDQEEYISYIPCAQDGSCNGLQHYSAMLRDPVGGQSVNLVDSEIPSDIYMDCVNKIIEYINYGLKYEKAFNGKEWVQAKPVDTAVYQGWLEFGITRAAAKKTTMVVPYGGTKISCRDSCRDYLIQETKKKKDHNKRYKNPFQKMKFNEINVPDYATTALHHLMWKSLDVIVVAARNAMRFLKKTTKVVVNTGIHGNMIYWDNPNGFRIYQDIKNSQQRRIKTYLEGTIKLSLKEDTKIIDKYKMQNSIAPNFVHGLDTTHLQKTICSAKDQGIDDFCTVHDSYAVHAGKCDILHPIIRQEFINLHAGNVLIDFWVTQCKRFPELIDKFPDVSEVKQGNLDLNQVKESKHFFR